MDALAKYLPEIESVLSQNNYALALRQIMDLSNRINAEPKLIGSIFGSRSLDNICQSIGAKALEQIAYSATDNVGLERNDTIFIVASEVYKTGGHTGVIRDLIRAYRDTHVVLLLTDFLDRVSLSEACLFFPGLEIRSAPKFEDSFAKLIWLQRQILTSRPKRTFLFNHMQDPIPVAALQPSLPTELVYYHHSDHRFALGAFLKHGIHVDFREAGLENCRYNLGIENNTLIPLTVEDNVHDIGNCQTRLGTALVTATSGGKKFESNYAFSFAKEVLPSILLTTGGTHVHIGKLSPDTVKQIRRGLDNLGIEQERFIQLEWVKSLAAALRTFSVDLYIDSFPICGCRSVVEAMQAGIPIAVHKNYKSRLLSNKDLVYEEAFCWNEPNDLYGFLKGLDGSELNKQAKASRLCYEHKHCSTVFAKSLEQLKGDIPFGVPRLPIYVNDEAFEFLECQEFKDSKPGYAFTRTEENLLDLGNFINRLDKNRIFVRQMPNLDKTSQLLYEIATCVLGKYDTDDKYIAESNIGSVILKLVEQPENGQSDYRQMSEFLFKIAAQSIQTNTG